MQKKTAFLLLSLLLFFYPAVAFAKSSSEDVLKKAQKELPQQCIFYFKMYLNASKPKAFAYAIDSKKKVTCRFSTSSSDQKHADEVALFSCKKSSLKKGIHSECKIYHTDNNISKSKKKLSFEDKYLLNLNTIKKDITATLKEQKNQKKRLEKKEKEKKRVAIVKKSISALPKPCLMYYNLYKEAGKYKAFAIAVDNEKKYVCRYSAKSSSQKKAQSVALASCEKIRNKRKVTHPCKIFVPQKIKKVEDKKLKKAPKKATQIKTKVAKKSPTLHKRAPKNPALEKAIFQADLKKIKKLIAKGADVDTQSSDDSRALFVAVAQGDIAFTKTLLKKGANPFFHKKDGNNLLVAAIMSGKNEILELILKQEIDPNIRCEEGNTPLHFALMMFDDKMMKTLYHYGARDDIKNNKGQSVTDLAKEYHVDLKRIKR
jgi:hypothetical protein